MGNVLLSSGLLTKNALSRSLIVVVYALGSYVNWTDDPSVDPVLLLISLDVLELELFSSLDLDDLLDLVLVLLVLLVLVLVLLVLLVVLLVLLDVELLPELSSDLNNIHRDRDNSIDNTTHINIKYVVFIILSVNKNLSPSEHSLGIVVGSLQLLLKEFE